MPPEHTGEFRLPPFCVLAVFLDSSSPPEDYRAMNPNTFVLLPTAAPSGHIPDNELFDPRAEQIRGLGGMA